MELKYVFLFIGNLVDWWHPQTKQKYMEKARCIIHQVVLSFYIEINFFSYYFHLVKIFSMATFPLLNLTT